MPYSIYLAWQAIWRPNQNNNIAPGGKLTGVRKVAFSSKLDIEVAQAKAKTQNLTLNDWVFACLTLAMSQICSLDTNKVQVSMPFSLVDFPDNAAQLKMGNNIAALPIVIQFP